ncbi:MAG: hypothetical protein NZ518_01820, partial [Dehalococcoidia bacterium]|nr:hypothetical protein [Dehalococcoidia bacterium]
PGNVAEIARRLHEQRGRRVVVSHMFTESSFYTTEKIPHALDDGIPSRAYGYNPATMLESPTMRTYILARVAEALRLHGLNQLIPNEAEPLACGHPLCRLNADVRVPPDEKPLVCLDLPCAWPR